MNIFINVTGASYNEQHANVLGTFYAARLYAVVDVVEDTLASRCIVLVEILLAMLALLIFIMVAGQSVVPVCIAGALWLGLYCVQWYCGTKARQALQPGVDFEYLWICTKKPLNFDSMSDATGVALDHIVKRLDVLENLSRGLMRRERKRRKDGAESVELESVADDLEATGRDGNWLWHLMISAQLDARYWDRAQAWCDQEEMVESDFVGGVPSCATQEEANAYLERLIDHLALRQASAERFRREVQRVREARERKLGAMVSCSF